MDMGMSLKKLGRMLKFYHKNRYVAVLWLDDLRIELQPNAVLTISELQNVVNEINRHVKYYEG